MSLTDLMSGMRLWVYPTVAIVIFLAAFAAILWRTYRRGSAEEHRAYGTIPLRDDREPVVHPGRAGAPKEARP